MLFKHEMEIGAAETEGADAGAARNVRGNVPRLQFGIDIKRRVGKVDVGTGMLAVHAGRQDFIAKRESSLQHSGCTRCSFQVADVRFDRTERDRMRWEMLAAEQVGNALRFYHIAHAGRGAVSFHQSCGCGRQTGILPGALQAKLLADWVGSGDAFAFAVARRTDAAEHGVDLVAIALGIGETLHHKDGRAFAHDETIGTFGIRTRAGGRERTDLAEFHEGLDAHVAVNAAGDDGVKSVGDQSLNGSAHRGHGGGAGCVANEIRAVEVVDIGDASGNAVGQFSGHAIFGNFGQVLTHSLM